MPAPRFMKRKSLALLSMSLAIGGALVLGVIYNTIKTTAQSDVARSHQTLIRIAITNFYQDHNAYPLISPYADHVGTADAELVHALDGTNPVINPGKTVYLTPPSGSLSPDDALIDPWGTPYHVHIDTTFNHRITNPEPDTGRPEIYTTVLVYSAGPDRDPTTWKDNITSWQ